MDTCSNSNDQDFQQSGITLGNDGSPVILENGSLSPLSLKDSPLSPGGRLKNKSIIRSIKGAFADDFCFESSPECANSQKRMIINGNDILSLTSKEVDDLSKEETKLYLSQLKIEGNLRKKGFRGFQMWKRRYFQIVGNSLMYYDVKNLQRPRKISEITMEGKVMVENIQNHPFAFSVRPNKGDQIYMIEAFNTSQRDQWIRFISLVIMLCRHLHSTTHTQTSFHKSLVLLDQLGRGRYGVVRLAQSRTTGEMYAVKIISKNFVNISILQQELAVLRVIKSHSCDPNIVGIYDIYEDPNVVHIVLEYMGGGDLYHRLITKRYFSEKEAANVIRRIGTALLSLHNNHVYHLDVKPENIIYESNDANAPMKLTDFGCSLLADHYNHNTNEIVGTAGFMAPEVISSCSYSAKADVYSLGVTLYILLMGYPPYQSDNQMELLEMTCKERVRYDEEDWSCISEDALLLVKNMLAKNPEERLSMKEVLEFRWVNHPPSSSNRWRQRLEKKQISELQMSFPSTLPGSLLNV